MRYLLILLLCLTGNINAAGPICHAFLAQRFFKHFPKYNDEEQKEFMMGTLFPDIRYIAKIKREATHDDHMSLEEILEEKSPFIAGMKFHSYVDLYREEYVNQQKLYWRYAHLAVAHHNSFFKFVEDEIVFDSVNKPECFECLKKVYPEEHRYQVEEKTIRRWHQLLQLSFSIRPTKLIYVLHLFNIGFLHLTSEQINVWNSTLQNFSETEEVQTYVKGMLEYIDNSMKAVPSQARGLTLNINRMTQTTHPVSCSFLQKRLLSSFF